MDNVLPIAAWDCDDVLVNLRDSMFKKVYEQFGVDISGTTDYNMHEPVGKTYDEMIQFIIDHKILEGTCREPGALTALSSAKTFNLSNVIVTARSHPKAVEVTKKNLGIAHNFVSEIHAIGKENKGDFILNKYGKVLVLVEDNFTKALDAWERNATLNIIIVRQPWNAEYEKDYGNVPGIEWVDGLRQAARIIIGMKRQYTGRWGSYYASR